MLKKFKMDSCKPIGTSVECKMKLSKFNEAEKVDATNFKSLLGILRYLVCIDQTFYMLLDSSSDTWRL